MEFVVPNYQVSSSETFQSNGMWSLNSLEASEKCFDYNTFYGSSLQDFEGIEQMDDMFLNSILEDVPGNDGGDVHLASSNINSVGSSSMYCNREVPMFDSHVIPLKGETPFTISDTFEENMLDSHLSSEELVLQDLQRASEKLTDETRKCFRDTFYRLARNSQEKLDSVSNHYEYGDATKLNKEKEMESETNSIDRTIANLTFNKMESNISNFPLPERVH